MRRKKPVGEPAPAPAPAVPEGAAREDKTGVLDIARVCLFTELLFLAMSVQTGQAAVVLPVLALALCVGRGPLRRLRERFCVPVIGFAAFAAVYGVAAVYASFGDYAVRELYKMTASVSVALILLVRFDKRHVRGLLWGIAAVCAALSVICTDGALNGGLFDAYNSMVEALGGTFSGVRQLAWGTRVAGIYNDANVTASILALGAFCGLHLTLTGKRRWERALAALLTGLSGMGFFLAMSRGAILCFGLALMMYLAAVGKGRRTRLFFLIALHTVVTVALCFLASSASMAGTAGPHLLSLACGLIVWAGYEFPGLWLAERLEGHGRVLAAIMGALVLCAGVYIVVAFRVTGTYTFGNNGVLFREVDLEAGEYTLTAGGGGDLTVSIYRQDEENWWRLYAEADKENPREVRFTLERSARVGAQFRGSPGSVLEHAAFSDGTGVPLGYPLLPEFVASRLQSNFSRDRSFTFRVQYDIDGWKLFKQSPWLGRGPGSTEGLLTSVQPFFYESLYLHNHVLQIMCDCGLLGAVPFLALLLGALWLLARRLWERRKEGGDPLAAALLGCWVMMNTHCLMELTFSIRAYQCVAFSLLMITAILYGRPLVKEKALRWAGLALNGALCLYLAVFAFGLERHRMVEREMRVFSTTDADEFMRQTQKWIEMDWFDKEQNRLNFVGNAIILGDSRYEEDMVRYAEALRKTGTYAACTGLAEYYYKPLGQLEEVFACSREAIAQEASTNDAWNQQIEFYRDGLLPDLAAADADVYIDGVLALADYLEDYSRGRREEIKLTDENRAFLDRVRQASGSGMDGVAAMMYLTIPR